MLRVDVLQPRDAPGQVGAEVRSTVAWLTPGASLVGARAYASYESPLLIGVRPSALKLLEWVGRNPLLERLDRFNDEV